MKKTEFVDGACFGYYDETFEECLKCRGREQCRKATKSPDAQNVKAVTKNSRDIVSELLRKWA